VNGRHPPYGVDRVARLKHRLGPRPGCRLRPRPPKRPGGVRWHPPGRRVPRRRCTEYHRGVNPVPAVDLVAGDHRIRAASRPGRCACRMMTLRTSPAPASTRILNTNLLMGIFNRHDGRLCRPLPARCAIMSAESGSSTSRVRPFYGY